MVSFGYNCADSRSNDKYIKEDDVDVRAVVEQTLRERGRIPEEDDSMDTS